MRITEAERFYGSQDAPHRENICSNKSSEYSVFLATSQQFHVLFKFSFIHFPTSLTASENDRNAF
jgi:hypothetical protein